MPASEPGSEATSGSESASSPKDSIHCIDGRAYRSGIPLISRRFAEDVSHHDAEPDI